MIKDIGIGSKLKTRRIWDISNYQDTYVIIEHINKKYPNSSLIFKKTDLNDGNLIIWQNLFQK